MDHVYALIARNRLYVDLYASWLKDQPHLPLYLDQPTAEAYALLRSRRRSAPFGHGDGAYLTTLSANAPLDWDGKRWTLLNLGKTATTLLPEEGTLIQLETPSVSASGGYARHSGEGHLSKSRHGSLC